MPPIALAVLFTLVAVLAYAANDGDWPAWANVLMVALVGYLLGENNRLASALRQLREAMANDWEQRHSAPRQQQPMPVEVEETTPPAPEVLLPITQPETPLSPRISMPAEPPPTIGEKPQPGLLDTVSRYVGNYFTGGNLFVRIGILVLFFGVSFLIKMASDIGLLPIEYRLAGVAASAVGLLGFGWHLRSRKPTYALLLQGAAIGILYLDVFAAFSLYQLIPPLLAFGLLFVFSMLAAALAVLQNAQSLSVLGFTGGFLAPILASSGSDNYVGLFSYYAILNLAIAAIAWFKAWRPLNLVGFWFTFIIASVWGAASYTPDKFLTTEPFLVFFFLLYVGIAVLYALRQPPKLKGYVDGTLLFGVPMAASGLQYSMLHDTQYGVAISAFCMGLLYTLLSRFVWWRKGETLRLLSEAFLALGVIFASLAIPFALAPSRTAAAWALEGLGLIWLGARQNRLSMRIFGMLLQMGAALFVAYDLDKVQRLEAFRQQYAFFNSVFISTTLMAVAGIGSAWLLSREFVGRKVLEKGVNSLFLIWGLLWLYGGFVTEFRYHLDADWLLNNLLLLSAVVSFGFGYWAQQGRWKAALNVALALFPAMLLMFPAVLDHPSQNGGWLAWPLAFGVIINLFYRLDKSEDVDPQASWYVLWHNGVFLLLLVWLGFEGAYQIEQIFTESQFVAVVWVALPALFGWWWLTRAKHWPLVLHKNAYLYLSGRVLAVYLLLWVLGVVMFRQDVSPLPWLPLLNPFDSLSVVILIGLFFGWRNNQSVFPAQVDKRYFLSGIAALLFLWLNTTLFRMAHHWWGIPYQLDNLLANSFVQTAISILWALTGVLITVFASRKQWRSLWLAGSVLLGMVVLKLFLVDLSQLGSLARVLSFIVVGILLISIGYFAPLPDDNKSGGNRS